MTFYNLISFVLIKYKEIMMFVIPKNNYNFLNVIYYSQTKQVVIYSEISLRLLNFLLSIFVFVELIYLFKYTFVLC